MKRRIKMVWVALFFRVGIAIGTTVVSGPSLISLVMYSDENNELLRRAMKARADQRAKVFAPSKEMDALKSEIDSLSVAIRKEIQGGVNGRPGTCGNVCRDLEARQHDLQTSYDTLQNNLKTAESAFDTLSEKWVANRVKSAGPAERGDALDALKDTPGYKIKRLTVAGMIWLLLAVMIVLKLLEPLELKLYYSRWMQAMWPSFRSQMGMSALSFFKRVKAGYWRLTHLLTRLDELKPKLEEEWRLSRSLAQERAAVKARVDDLRLQHGNAESVVANARHILEKVDVSGIPPISVENWSAQLAAAKARLEEAKRLLPAEDDKLAQIDRDIRLVAREVSRLQAEVDGLQEAIDTTARSIDQSSINDWPDESPA